ncbi:Hpt domain-containing protein [uncultured Desulfosarcina sp.]|uniref:Hpt domain-containing protein n=1 Tax=uncultured Desulfosarcina sp. TaxID=218289 RepID=UPI0029C8A6E7|nr:Hpt domain-containing protein [uncultured Desulfosarcina sp.]
MTDQSLIADFADEAREHLEELESSLLRLESDPGDRELLDTIFRSMHTIKGSSEYLGFERIAQLSHRLENLLDLFRDGSLTADKVTVDLLIDARDRIGTLISQVEQSGQETAEIGDLLDRIETVSAGPTDGGGESDNAPAYEGEADTELFDIFMEQLIAGLGELMETARQAAGGEDVAGAMGRMSDQVERLSGTANYMGYTALVAVYDKMLSELEAFASGAKTAEPPEIEAFLKSSLVDGIGRIRELFPNADGLATIDTGCSIPVEQDLAESKATEEPAPDIIVADPKRAEKGPEQEADLDLDFDFDLGLDLENERGLEADNSESAPRTSQMTDQSLIADFADEAREHLEELESSLLRLESDPGDRELLDTIFRSMHTIKGSSEYLGFERIAQLSHRLENLLDLFRDGSLTADKVTVDLLIDARDRIGTLISQVEQSGQETAEIGDLLDRIETVSAGPTDGGGESDNAPAYEGEADTELFDIFMEQLIAGLGELMETARQAAGGEDVAGAMGRMSDQVERLSGTANYMGYTALVAVYDKMLSELEAFASGAKTAEPPEIEAFLKSSLVDGIGRIRELFPNADGLSTIDTSVPSSLSPNDGDADEPLPEEPPVSTVLDELLPDLPTIDDAEKESLLSRMLDETFSSMQESDGDTDSDPIALQFSTPWDDTASSSIPTEANQEAESTSSILDDFGSESVASHPSAEEQKISTDQPPADSDENEIDLWPEAPKVSIPVPEAVDSPAEVQWPKLDLTAGDVPAEKGKEAAAPEETFSARSSIRRSIRVDAEKVDDLMNQVGELVVNRSSFAQLSFDLRELTQYLNRRFPMEKNDQRMLANLTTRFNDAATVLGRVSNELQEQVMKVRMLPIARLFSRYSRLVHDLLKDSDKKIQLQFRGEETELDRMIIEQLADPLIHIIRNAVDHGIESREVRTSKGKPESGTLLLEAFHEGSNVVIEITDDGHGIDLSRICEKAIEKHLVDRETLEKMNQKEIIDMIMLPGFSTADEITHTSGRGVGMDVVKRNIEKINGSLDIETRQDLGTRIRIKIPLTLAIIPAMMVRCGGSHFTVPMGAIQETLRIDPGEIFTVDGSEVMHLREEPLPLVRLAALLNIPAAAERAADQRLIVMVIRSVVGNTGFIVDQLLGRQEVVIKPLEDYLREDSGFSGATVLGDGGISLILNVDELSVMAKEREAGKKLAAVAL